MCLPELLGLACLVRIKVLHESSEDVRFTAQGMEESTQQLLPPVAAASPELQHVRCPTFRDLAGPDEVVGCSIRESPKGRRSTPPQSHQLFPLHIRPHPDAVSLLSRGHFISIDLNMVATLVSLLLR